MKYIKTLLIVGIVGVLLYFFLHSVDFAVVIGIIKDLNPIYPLLFLAGMYIQYFVRSYRWGLLLKPRKAGIRLTTLYNYTVIGFLLSTLIPGKVGEPARGILLAREEKIKSSYGLASVVLDRLIDVMVLVLLFISSLFFIGGKSSPLLEKLKVGATFAVPIILFVFLMFYLINRPKVFGYVEKLIRFFARLLPVRVREKVVRFLVQFVQGLRLNLGPLDFLKLFVSSLLVWIIQIPFYWFLMQGFSFGSGVGFFETVPYFSLIVASAAIPTPGMAGSFDAASRHGLEQLYGVDTNAAAAYTILAHFLIIVNMIVPGLIALWSKGLSFSSIRGIKAKEEES